MLRQMQRCVVGRKDKLSCTTSIILKKKICVKPVHPRSYIFFCSCSEMISHKYIGMHNIFSVPFQTRMSFLKSGGDAISLPYVETGLRHTRALDA